MAVPRHDAAGLNDELAQAQALVGEVDLLLCEFDVAQHSVRDVLRLHLAAGPRARARLVGRSLAGLRRRGQERHGCHEGCRAQARPEWMDLHTIGHGAFSSALLLRGWGSIAQKTGEKDQRFEMPSRLGLDSAALWTTRVAELLSSRRVGPKLWLSLGPFVLGGDHGNASSPLFSRGRRRAELHPRRRKLPRGPALAHAGGQIAGRGAWRSAVPPRAGQDASVRTRAHGEAVPWS